VYTTDEVVNKIKAAMKRTDPRFVKYQLILLMAILNGRTFFKEDARKFPSVHPSRVIADPSSFNQLQRVLRAPTPPKSVRGSAKPKRSTINPP